MDHPLAGPNPVPAHKLNRDQRLTELATLLAAGIIRARLRREKPTRAKSSQVSADIRDSSLDILGALRRSRRRKPTNGGDDA